MGLTVRRWRSRVRSIIFLTKVLSRRFLVQLIMLTTRDFEEEMSPTVQQYVGSDLSYFSQKEFDVHLVELSFAFPGYLIFARTDLNSRSLGD